eukprot:5999522-Ditylum_brightwellii.AAC.1
MLQQAKDKRKSHNQKLAEIHALSGDMTADHTPKAIINTKTMSNMWKKINFADKGSQNNNMTLIQFPASTSSTRTCRDNGLFCP